VNSETQWKAKLRRELDMVGVSLSLHGHGMQAPGWPDLFVGSSVWSGWVELKAHDGELNTAQRIVGRKLAALGLHVVARASRDWKTMLLETVEGERMPESMACGILDARRMLELAAG